MTSSGRLDATFAALAEPTRRGRAAQRRPRRLEPEPFAEATAWLEKHRQLWAANFRRLEALLGQLTLHQLGAKDKKGNAQNVKGSPQ